MTTVEFSNEFDILVDGYSRFKALDNKQLLDSLEFNEYEKSLFLTQAQEELVLSYYSGRNSESLAFEGTEEVRRYLDTLVKTQKSTLTVINTNNITDKSVFFALPANDDLWFIIYEVAGLTDPKLQCEGRQEVPVVPTTHDALQKTLRNPFRQPNERRVLRLDITGNIVELVSPYIISDYTVRYISKPEPIILTVLPNALTINGVSNLTECKLKPILHRTILEKAVDLAIRSKVGNGLEQKPTDKQ